jgi:hypothetical protein
VVKQGEANGGVTQTTPAVTEDRAEEGQKDTREWKEARTWDWNRSLGVPAAMVVRPRSTPRESVFDSPPGMVAQSTGAPSVEGGLGVVAVGSGGGVLSPEGVGGAGGGASPRASPRESQELLNPSALFAYSR